MTRDPAMQPEFHSLESERACLGAVLLAGCSGFESGAKVFDAIAHLQASDFYDGRHGQLLEALRKLREQQQPLDAVTVYDLVTDGPYVMELANSTPSSVNAAGYAERIREQSLRREATEIGQQLVETGDADSAAQALVDLTTRGQTGRTKTAKDAVKELFVHTEKLVEGELVGGIPTGWPALDGVIGGWGRGDLVIVAGRPGMCKTAFALNASTNLAMNGNPVFFYSGEMPMLQLSQRLVSRKAQIDFGAMRSGDLKESDWPRFTSAMAEVKDWPLHIDDQGYLAFEQLRARARRIKAKHGLDLLAIDYLQILQPPKGKNTRNDELSDITRRLKALAKELDCCVMLLSQLNRQVEQRKDRRPVMSDLRESGAIEQDADLILFPFRPGYYDEQPLARNLEVGIGKQRNGVTGRVGLRWLGEYQGVYTWDDYADGPFNFWTPQTEQKAPRGFRYKEEAA